MTQHKANPIHCPTCDVSLMPIRHREVTVHYCPECCGGWLARPDLDRVLYAPPPHLARAHRVTTELPRPAPPTAAAAEPSGSTFDWF